MSNIRIIGIGSPFGNDQLGWQVIEYLQKMPSLKKLLGEQLQLIACDRPGTKLLEMIQGASKVYLIDAIKNAGGAEGSIHRLDADELSEVKSALSSHALGVAEAIQIGQVLGGLPEIIMYGIQVDEVGVYFKISPTLRDAARNAAYLLEQEILLIDRQGV